jgi:hypothetical protein
MFPVDHLPYLLSLLLLDQQPQLFQLFHFWHVFAGFSLKAFLRSFHKEASSFVALLLKDLFILLHLLSA